MEENLKLAENLKALRTAMKLTQSEVADIIDKDRSSVAKYESGSARPPFNILLQFAKLYDVTIDELCGFEVSSPLVVRSKAENNQSLDSVVSGFDRQEQMMILKFKVMDKEKRQELLKIFEELSKK